jgi:predicted nucleotidyltransferase
LKEESRMAKKPLRHPDFREIFYSERHWVLLEKFRKKTMRVMKVFEQIHFEPITHGSIARGDVHKKSDIDIFLPNQPSSFIVETALEKADIPANRRLIVQATPTYTVKAQIEIDENTSISFPLTQMRKVEREFYNFGGEATLKDLEADSRVAGVNKQLTLIEPTEKGHKESAVVGREEQVAKLLGITAETVKDRVRTLLRRDDVGRTGVFLKKELHDNETFEETLKRVAEQNPAIRRRLRMS